MDRHNKRRHISNIKTTKQYGAQQKQVEKSSSLDHQESDSSEWITHTTMILP